MIAYYITTIIGNGTNDNPYRSKVSDYGINYSSVIDLNKKNWCLVVVNTEDHSQLIADNQIREISSDLLETTWGELNTAKKNKITQALTYSGISFTPTNDTTILQILNALLHSIDSFGNLSKIYTSV